MSKVIFLVLAFAVAVVTAQQCTYTPNNYTFPVGQYPVIWQRPNATIFSTAEFMGVYNSINWTAVPNIPPKQMDAQGAFISANYSATDPDCWWSYKTCVTPKFPGIKPDLAVCPEPDTWGLTYDDGPNCTEPVLYDFLKQNNQKASMFYIGSNVANWPSQAQRALMDGHQIAVHTWSHPYMTTLTNQEVVGELYYTRKVIKYVLGVTPLYWRPPFGDVDDRVRAIAMQLNMSTVLWDQDTDDWQMIPAGSQPQSFVDGKYQDFINRGLNGTYSTHGTIVLSHELNNGTISESIKWYPQVQTAYKYIMPVASCFNITQPYAESNIVYPTFAQLASNTSSTPSTSSANGSTTTVIPNSNPKSSASSLTMTIAVSSLVVFAVFAML